MAKAETPVTYLVFLRDGTVTEVADEVTLHNMVVREDYAFTLANQGLDTVANMMCEEYGLPTRVYAEVIEDALTRGAITAGSAACMTLEAQRDHDEGYPPTIH